MASRAPALGLPLEQLQAHISGKQQHQLEYFCASFRYRSFQSLRLSRFANMESVDLDRQQFARKNELTMRKQKPGIISRAFQCRDILVRHSRLIKSAANIQNLCMASGSNLLSAADIFYPVGRLTAGLLE
jgi:hypothetical protein